MEKVKVRVDELLPKFESKSDLYNVCKYQLKFYLPTYRRCPVSFLKAIFSGDKSVYLTNEIRIIDAPTFNELSVKNLWPEFKQNELICKYIPDYDSPTIPEREFLLNIVNNVYPESINKILVKCYESRNLAAKNEDKDLIVLTPDIKKKIEACITYKTTSGRAISMLKQASNLKKKKTVQIKHSIDLRIFKHPPILRVRRLIASHDFQGSAINRAQDEIMDEEKEEEKHSEDDN